jgi:hypothetical protein
MRKLFLLITFAYKLDFPKHDDDSAALMCQKENFVSMMEKINRAKNTSLSVALSTR